jgi:RNA polymerase sigma-70 factor (ECF subfamily)
MEAARRHSPGPVCLVAPDVSPDLEAPEAIAPTPAEAAAGSASAPAPLDVRAIFEAEYGYVLQSLRRLGVAEADLDDLVQETLLAVHRRQDTYDRARPLRPWLFGVAFRVASEFRRLARNRREVVKDVDRADDGLDPEGQAARAEERGLVLRALEGMDLDRRAVFVMCDIDEASAPEVAAALGIPLNTVYSRLRVARQEFTAAARRLRGTP